MTSGGRPQAELSTSCKQCHQTLSRNHCSREIMPQSTSDPSLRHLGAPKHTMATARMCNLSRVQDASSANMFEETALITFPNDSLCPAGITEYAMYSANHNSAFKTLDPKMTSARLSIMQQSPFFFFFYIANQNWSKFSGWE